MANKKSTGLTMRIIHRYLGFFLAGVMAVYAVSGIVLIFRNTDTFKKETHIEKTIDVNINADELGEALKMKRLKVEKQEGDVMFFKDGTYNSQTGVAAYTVKELPLVLDKLTHLHKATTKDPLFYFNIFFGLSLMFFVLSAFWMFLPSTSTFRKGLYFTAGGIVLVLIMLFV
jgi:hypothetical protein